MPKTSCGADGGLRSLSARTIVAALADAAERWCDADFPPRVRATAAIEARTGYTIPVIDYALDRLFGGITRRGARQAIAGELGSLEILDSSSTGPAPRPRGPAVPARRPSSSSDTTIGVAIVPLVFALAAKCAVTVKDRADALVSAFVQTLGEERPELAAATCVRTWTGGEDDVEAVALGAADVVVAFGSDEALRAIRARCAPGATFVPFGHRASAGYLTRRALAGDGAALAATSRATRCSTTATAVSRCTCCSSNVPPAARTSASSQLLADACAAHAIDVSARPPRCGSHGAHQRLRRGGRVPGRQRCGPCAARADGAWNIVVDPPPGDLPPFGGGVIPVMFVDDAEAAASVPSRAPHPVAGARRRRPARRRRAALGANSRRGSHRAASAACRIRRWRDTTAAAPRIARLRPLDRSRVNDRFESIVHRPGPRSRELNALIERYEAPRRHLSRRRLSDRVGDRARGARDRRGRQPLLRSHRGLQRRRTRPHQHAVTRGDRGAGAAAGPRHGRRAPDRRQSAAARTARGDRSGRLLEDLLRLERRRRDRVRSQDRAARDGPSARALLRRAPITGSRSARCRSAASRAFASRSRRSIDERATFLPFPGADASLDGALGARAALADARRSARSSLEPIQGRGGVIVPPAGFLARHARAVRRASARPDRRRDLHGFGRTGTMFACEREGVVPDILCLGKAIAGGVPFSAAIGRPAVVDAWPAATGEALHTATFLGNPLACAAALAVLDEFERAADRRSACAAAERGCATRLDALHRHRNRHRRARARHALGDRIHRRGAANRSFAPDCNAV